MKVEIKAWRSTDNRMVFRSGVVEIAGGEVSGIDFESCQLTLGPSTSLSDCTFDDDCVISVAEQGDK